MQFLSIAVFCGHSPAYSKNVLWKGSSFRTGKRYLKIKVGGLSLPSVKSFLAATAIRIMWLQSNTRRSMQQTRGLRIGLYKYAQLMFDKGTKAHQWRNGATGTGHP